MSLVSILSIEIAPNVSNGMTWKERHWATQGYFELSFVFLVLTISSFLQHWTSCKLMGSSCWRRWTDFDCFMHPYFLLTCTYDNVIVVVYLRVTNEVGTVPQWFNLLPTKRFRTQVMDRGLV